MADTRVQLEVEDRIFPISYSTARMFIRKLGKKLNLTISPHDLRRYSATYASRNGVPLEIVSKVILQASGSQNNPDLSRQGQRTRSDKVDGYIPRKVRKYPIDYGV